MHAIMVLLIGTIKSDVNFRSSLLVFVYSHQSGDIRDILFNMHLHFANQYLICTNKCLVVRNVKEQIWIEASWIVPAQTQSM